MKFELVGIRVDRVYGYGIWTTKLSDVRKTVATFDNKSDVILYIENSTLKNPPNRERPFKNKSLLINFEYAIIRETQPESHLPHNPKM